ncbi:hypothetical protein C4M96_01710 [Mycoplasmopsis pullorum]|uniref:MSC_0623 family F1-like ATPase-associated protein n=1 Tax=Mycoplasmopsis pullorum TaxID=48003 RepID=UPI001119BA76|nr:DUF2714 domain-containing protein [Mycoplasmopsis pullorum]TNK82967.1 hypothetical protein C4M93_03210 [Mycoplasmopsis pullorum]TNK92189.1 hypothetical protein C4M96_01710 [Mycoplasmopsis pullorum]
MLFNKKTKKYSKEEIEYQNLVFSTYEKARESKNFLDYSTFTNEVLLELNLSSKNPIWVEITEKSQEQIDTRNEIVFKNFIISFVRDTRFSLHSLVPTLSHEPNVNLKSLNLSIAKDPETNQILQELNKVIEKLLNKGFLVEIVPEIIVEYDVLIDKYSIYFGKKFIK